jgi:hypothetical protein
LLSLEGDDHTDFLRDFPATPTKTVPLAPLYPSDTTINRYNQVPDIARTLLVPTSAVGLGNAQLLPDHSCKSTLLKIIAYECDMGDDPGPKDDS